MREARLLLEKKRVTQQNPLIAGDVIPGRLSRDRTEESGVLLGAIPLDKAQPSHPPRARRAWSGEHEFSQFWLGKKNRSPRDHFLQKVARGGNIRVVPFGAAIQCQSSSPVTHSIAGLLAVARQRVWPYHSDVVMDWEGAYDHNSSESARRDGAARWRGCRL